jgi:NAD(P)-dependent dehydrogenase (short-subunit alcohol dehydrogenase family)
MASALYSQLIVSLPWPTTQQNGRTVIVTGSNTGLGKEAARHFARLGAARVILAVRNTKAGEAAKLDIEKTTNVPEGVVQVWELDLASYASVKAFAAKANKELDRLDILLENAGIATPNWKLAEGEESTITVNVISTLLLGLLLLPKLKETAKKTDRRTNLCIVSSSVHEWTTLPEKSAPDGKILDYMSDEKTAAFKERYPESKLLEVFAVRAMGELTASPDYPVTINCLNPGLCHSELSRESGFGLEVMKFFLARSSEAGSRTLVSAAIAGKESHGQYENDCVVAPPSSFVTSEEGKVVQKRVWDELVGRLEKISPGVTKNL